MAATSTPVGSANCYVASPLRCVLKKKKKKKVVPQHNNLLLLYSNNINKIISDRGRLLMRGVGG